MDQRLCLVLRHRPAEQITLHLTETFSAQLLQLLFRLDPFGQRRRVEAGTDADDGAHDGEIAGIRLNARCNSGIWRR